MEQGEEACFLSNLVAANSQSMKLHVCKPFCIIPKSLNRLKEQGTHIRLMSGLLIFKGNTKVICIEFFKRYCCSSEIIVLDFRFDFCNATTFQIALSSEFSLYRIYFFLFPQSHYIQFLYAFAVCFCFGFYLFHTCSFDQCWLWANILHSWSLSTMRKIKNRDFMLASC